MQHEDQAIHEDMCNGLAHEAEMHYAINAEAEEAEMNAAYEEMKPIIAMHSFEGLTKSKIKDLGKIAVENVLHNGNPLTIAETISVMEHFIKEVKESKEFKDYVREETIKNGKEYISQSGAKIEVAEVGTKYDFSQCGDIELGRLESQFTFYAEELQKRKDFLKTVSPSGLLVTDEQTGDTYKVYPPSKTSTSSYKITLAK